ncbi:hypothetical protein LXA43DRAFT_1061135 [Ganoderma leucocontextum]|nr:hypothetical protein LXA43DRAFT_1061135 [Ganoderma leucocontextum]
MSIAWKIACVLRVAAISPEDVLIRATKYAQDLIDFDKWWSKLFTGKPCTEENQDGVTHEQFLHVFKTAGGLTSGIAIRYGTCYLRIPTSRSWSSPGTCPIITTKRNFCRRPPKTRAGELPEAVRILGRCREVGGVRRAVLQFGEEGPGWVPRSSARTTPSKYRALFNSTPGRTLTASPSRASQSAPRRDMHGCSGGGGYAKYSIDERAGAIVVVRPDGYVGTIAPSDAVAFLNAYFSAFLL